MLDNFLHYISSHPIYLSIGTFLSEDLSYLYGLSLVQQNKMSSLSFIFYYCLGVIVGDLILYGLGASGQFIPAVNRWLKKKNQSQKPQTEIGGFETFLMLTRFLPGTRFVTYTYSGLKSYNIFKFTFILTFSTLIQVITGVLLVSAFKGLISTESSGYVHFTFSLLICFLSLALLKLVTTAILFKKRYGEILRPIKTLIVRKKSMEFWSPWTFYLPFVPKFFQLMFKYGSFSHCLQTNPVIYMSGFLGEKKSDIDELLKKYLPENSLRTYRSSDTIQNFPIVAKPDSGLRGIDVKKIFNQEELNQHLKMQSKEIVLQELSNYENEWGVFYIRYPDQTKGTIFSITNKVLPFVLGDGKSSIYHLVMTKPLLKERFDWVFKEYSGDIHRVPLAGEKVSLGFKGSHSKGCLFLEGEQYLAKAEPIARALDNIPGFYIGRADVKYESVETIEQGKFHLLELNGAAAESTNFYDPKYNPTDIMRILSKQWEHIFKIGKINSNRVSPKTTLWEFFREILIYKKILNKKD